MGGRVRDLFHVKLLASLIVCLSVAPAFAQDQETIDNALGEQFTAYTSCLKDHALQLAKTSEAEQTVVDRVFDACLTERRAVLEASQKPPLGFSTGRAVDEMTKADNDLRPLVLDTVKKARS